MMVFALSSAKARSKPRIPKSRTCTPGGCGRAAKRWATSTPKASSPKKILPMPATRIWARVMIAGPYLLAEGALLQRNPAEVRFPREKRRSDARRPAAATCPGRALDRPRSPPPRAAALRNPLPDSPPARSARPARGRKYRRRVRGHKAAAAAHRRTFTPATSMNSSGTRSSSRRQSISFIPRASGHHSTSRERSRGGFANCFGVRALPRDL